MNMPDAGLALCILFTTLMLYDLWRVRIKGTGSSVSDWLIRVGFYDPPVVAGIMFLAGHLFGGMRLNPDPAWYTPGYNIAFSLYLVGFFGTAFCLCYLLKRRYRIVNTDLSAAVIEATSIIQDARDIARGGGPMFPKLGQRGDAWLEKYGNLKWLGMNIRLDSRLTPGTMYLENSKGERVYIGPEDKK